MSSGKQNLIEVSPVSASGKPAGKVRVLTLFGTRPEVIKVAPILRELDSRADEFTAINVTSGQHTDLLYPLVELFGLRIDHDLKIMRPNQSLSGAAARVLSSIDPILESEKPDVLLVQGDTTTALAGALAAFHRRIPVGHIEAGLRSGNPTSPFPEEMNRRLITQVASMHFAATTRNHSTLLAEGVPAKNVFLTGNPVVDSLQSVAQRAKPTDELKAIIAATEGTRRILLTTHRRESFGETMGGNLRVLRAFVEKNPGVSLIFPVHPNPSVSGPAREILGNCPRIHLATPLGYEQFVVAMSHAWLIVSDSGGVQEEAPSLGKPLLILRENTERPEAVESGVARLVGGQPQRLAELLNEAIASGSWVETIKIVTNPFGDGHSARRIADAILQTVAPATVEVPA